MQTTTLIGMDISKYSFEIFGLDVHGKQTLHKRINRDQVSLFFSNFPPCTIAMEACGSSQHWARKLHQLGHQVRLIPAQHVIPFRRGPKNDRNDAEAIAEAAARPRMRTATVKTLEQQDIQAIASRRWLKKLSGHYATSSGHWRKGSWPLSIGSQSCSKLTRLAGGWRPFLV